MRLRFIGLFFLLLVSTTTAKAESIDLKINSMAPATAAKTLVTNYLKKLLEERSHGRIHVQVINGFNMTAAQAVRDLKQQPDQIIIPEIRDLSQLVPYLKVFELPFLYRDRQHLHQVIDQKIGLGLLSTGVPKNLKLLGIWEKGANYLFSDSALPSPDAVADKSLRGAAQQTSTFYFRTISPCLPPGLSADQKHASWCETTLPEVVTQPAENRLANLTLTQHSIASSALLTDMFFWQHLAEDLKVIISDAVKDATIYARELALHVQGRIQIHQLSHHQRQLWRNKMLRLYSATNDEVEKKLIEKIIHYQPVN